MSALTAAATVAAVLVDLDDTLFPQRDWLVGAWQAVARAAAAYGLPARSFAATLGEVARGGSDRGRIIDRALAAAGRPDVPVAPLVAAFHGHAPAVLRPYPGVPQALARLRARVPVGLVTDGEPAVQHGKVAALGLAGAFDTVVFSDRLGRGHRKPHPAPFLAALAELGVPPGAAVHIGDRPDKDVAGAVAAGLRAVRVRTGEYAGQPDPPATWMAATSFPAAVDRITGVGAGDGESSV